MGATLAYPSDYLQKLQSEARIALVIRRGIVHSDPHDLFHCRPMGSSKIQFPRGSSNSRFGVLDYRRNRREIRTARSQVEMVGAVVGGGLLVAVRGNWPRHILCGW